MKPLVFALPTLYYGQHVQASTSSFCFLVARLLVASHTVTEGLSFVSFISSLIKLINGVSTVIHCVHSMRHHLFFFVRAFNLPHLSFDKLQPLNHPFLYVRKFLLSRSLCKIVCIRY
uniref:Uncharacterized protein n=1 Tax=Trypanosoma congolense (strain IL3000) TaxID=1068625 RepID=F9WH86_TRYCI|nr:hypothetical protein, unlikely [Trypanosoma congolense IL3000]